ncbi:hypothetical protein B0H14DRAFT_3643491 [Mycena olivaceomarginata]|nr:hypothetical protein B0H14DRAFT_3643491 [Mycena olivaceomarginata]
MAASPHSVKNRIPNVYTCSPQNMDASPSMDALGVKALHPTLRTRTARAPLVPFLGRSASRIWERHCSGRRMCSTSTTLSATSKTPVFTRLRSQFASFPAVEDKAKGGGGEYFPSGSKAERRISFFAQSLTAELPVSIPVSRSRFPYSTPIDPPTISVVIHANSSPLGGTEGTKHMLMSHTHGAPPSPPTPPPLPIPAPTVHFARPPFPASPIPSTPSCPIVLPPIFPYLHISPSSFPSSPSQVSLHLPCSRAGYRKYTRRMHTPRTHRRAPQEAEQLTCALAEEDLVPTLELDVHTSVVNAFLWGEKGNDSSMAEINYNYTDSETETDTPVVSSAVFDPGRCNISE